MPHPSEPTKRMTFLDALGITRPPSETADRPSPDPVHGVGQRDPINGQVIRGANIRVGLCIGKGSFGQVRAARNLKTKEVLAVKLEPDDANESQLENEWRIYQVLNKQPAAGIPKAYLYSLCGAFRALAMEMLGPSLEQVFRIGGSSFSLHTIIMLTIEMINRLEYLHGHLIVHRDIKPANFLIVNPPKQDNTIYIIDFGLSKYYMDPTSKSHIPYAEHDEKVGTSCYMSIRAHLGIEQSRRDDLESLGYVLVYFLRGALPWEDFAKVKDDAHNKLVFDMKKTLRIEDLCTGHPPEFVKYMQYVRKLEFQQTPDYNYLRHMFVLRLELLGLSQDGGMDWNKSKYGRRNVSSIKS